MFTKEQLLNGIKRSRKQADKASDKRLEIKAKLIACRTVRDANRLSKLQDKWDVEYYKATDSIDRMTRLMIDQGFTMTREEAGSMMMKSDKSIKMRGDVMFEAFQAPKNRKMFFKGSELIGIYIF